MVFADTWLDDIVRPAAIFYLLPFPLIIIP
jgi:hypothetical protein